MKNVNVAVVGATGMVGSKIIEILEERNFPAENIYFLASKKSAGQVISFKGKDYTVEELNEAAFDKEIDIALFSAGGEISKVYGKLAREKGITVVDNSSAWRLDEDVPLVVPEVNPEEIDGHKGIIANPNCSTIQVMPPLKALDDAFGIKRVVYSTYQSVSGSGVAGIRDLDNGIEGLENTNYPHQIAFNCLPHIDSFLENGYTKEEMKMIEETRKILKKPDLKVTATTVRVPVRYSHSVSVNLEFEKEFDIKDVFKALENKAGIVVQDQPEENIYPMAISAEGSDQIYVGRIRRDFSLDNGINMWVVADNIRKGAATNTVQIAELLVK